ncbi:MAG: LytTR family transcriptional regulator [Bacteroidales bacterium]|nr:LytTR family transcriptional regulator [Bacteroidales bacterium]
MLKKYLIISTNNDLVRIAPERIVFISSDGNYSNIVLTDNETRMLTFQLGQIEVMIREQLGTLESGLFIRIGRGLIINRNYIYYINVQSQKLILSDNNRFTHTASASKEALKQLKELIEKEAKE